MSPKTTIIPSALDALHTQSVPPVSRQYICKVALGRLASLGMLRSLRFAPLSYLPDCITLRSQKSMHICILKKPEFVFVLRSVYAHICEAFRLYIEFFSPSPRIRGPATYVSVS